MAIYTRKGDGGETGIFSGKRVSKDDLIIEVLGTIDEANSFLGLSASLLDEKYLINEQTRSLKTGVSSRSKEWNSLRDKITQVQKTLFKLGSIVAGIKGTIPKSLVTKYEREIDEWVAIMPPLNNFIFPGGCPAAASLYTARAVVRRLERLIVSLHNSSFSIHDSVFVYINRLSDYLFVLARYINFRKGVGETVWKNAR